MPPGEHAVDESDHRSTAGSEPGAPADKPHSATADSEWPRGFGEASVWPGVSAVGAAGIYFGVAGVFLARAGTLVGPPWLSAVVLVAGIGAFLGGLFGWAYHGFVAEYFARATGEDDALRWGMVFFLATDVATFGAGFVYYFVVRSGTWPPHDLPPLLTSLVLVNTLLLLSSSLTMHVAHTAIQAGKRRRFLASLGATVLLGVLFVAGQTLEYAELLGEAELSVTSIYFSGFFALTGLHGAHVALGVVLLSFVLVRALRGQFSAERHAAVVTVSMYWHFVDVVWVFLVATLYVGAVA